MKNQIKGKKGITLIALIVTIIVLLILAGVTIATLTGDNGLLQKATNAKESKEIGEEKEIIGLSVIQARSNNLNGALEKSKLDEALNENSKENNKASVLVVNPDSYIIQFATSQRYYEVKDGKVENFKVDEWATVKYVNRKVNGEVVQEFSSLETKCPIISNSYSIVPPKIEGYEPEADVVTDTSRIISDANGKKTITIEYYKVLTKEDLNYTPYTENGEEKYQLSGIKDTSKIIKSVLHIPETYNSKTVSIIGQNSFQSNSNIFKIKIPSTIKEIKRFAFQYLANLSEVELDAEIIETCAFEHCYNLKELKIGKNVKSIGGNSFGYCRGLKNMKIYSEQAIINNTQFQDTVSLEEIKVSDDNSKYIVKNRSFIFKRW